MTHLDRDPVLSLRPRFSTTPCGRPPSTSLVYAILRYHIAGDVAWRHFPLFILNKATSLAAVVFVGASYLIGKAIRWYGDDKPLQFEVPGVR